MKSALRDLSPRLQRAPTAPTGTEIELRDARITALVTSIADAIDTVGAEFAAQPLPTWVVPETTPLSEPMPSKPDTLASRLRSQWTEGRQAATAEFERRADRESVREERMRRDREIEELQVARWLVAIPLDAVARGVANRGTARLQRAEPASAPLATPEERRRADAQYRTAPVHVEAAQPFAVMHALMERLTVLRSTHFRSGPSASERSGGAPSHLDPGLLLLVGLKWPPHPQVRRDLHAQFLAACARSAGNMAQQAAKLLRDRVAEIERYPPTGPEGGESIRP